MGIIISRMCCLHSLIINVYSLKNFSVQQTSNRECPPFNTHGLVLSTGPYWWNLPQKVLDIFPRECGVWKVVVDSEFQTDGVTLGKFSLFSVSFLKK